MRTYERVKFAKVVILNFDHDVFDRDFREEIMIDQRYVADWLTQAGFMFDAILEDPFYTSSNKTESWDNDETGARVFVYPNWEEAIVSL